VLGLICSTEAVSVSDATSDLSTSQWKLNLSESSVYLLLLLLLLLLLCTFVGISVEQQHIGHLKLLQTTSWCVGSVVHDLPHVH